MIGIVVPAHNEQDLIAECVTSVLSAARNARLGGEVVQLVVVADCCNDCTRAVAEAAGALTLETDVRNVGAARARGAELLLSRGARWLSFTDADTTVSSDWLAEQIALGVDVVCGTVGVADWTPHGDYAETLRNHFQQTYFDVDAHRHIHGANLGVSAAAYRKAGGFLNLACSEDVALVQALERSGASIAWSARPRVTTSARRDARASGGFADALLLAISQKVALTSSAGA